MPHLAHDAKLLTPRAKLSRARLAIYAGLTALVGIVVVVVIFAATGSLAFEAESGTLGSPAAAVTVTGASGGKAVQFGGGATPTPSPSSTPTAGWPGPNNTGVPAGTKLTVTGDIDITTDGTVIDSKEVHGSIEVTANNVTIKNTKILGGRIYLPLYCGATDCNIKNLMVTDTEVDGQGLAGNSDNGTAAFGNYGGFSCIRCNLHGWNLGIQLSTDGPVVIKDSWVHDLCCDSEGHKSAFGTNASSNVTVEHNNFECALDGCSGAMVMYAQNANDDNWLVDDNLFNSTGSYCTYAGSDPKKTTHITWTNNHYGRKFGPKCGQYGPTTGWQDDPTNKWSGNVWDDTGATINP